MRTENTRIRSSKATLPQENLGHTAVVAHPVDAMVQAGGTAPDTNGATTGKLLGDIPALFTQFGQLQQAHATDNKKQGMLDAMQGKAPETPSHFMNIGVGYDEGYYASKDEIQGLAFNTALKNALKEHDNFSSIDDPKLLEQKMNELYTDTYGKYFTTDYMGSRKELTYEGAARVTQGRLEAMQEVMNKHTEKRIETKLTGAFGAISDYMSALHTTNQSPEDTKKAIQSQLDVAFEHIGENVSRDQFDSMIVQKLSTQAGDLSQSGDPSATQILHTLRDLYGDKQVPGKNGEAVSRYGQELDALETQINRNLLAHETAKEKAKDHERDDNSSSLLSKAYALDPTDTVSLNNLREEAIALAAQNKLKNPKTVLETIDHVFDDAGFARHDDAPTFQSAFVRAIKGSITLEEINNMKGELSRSSWLQVMNKFNETSKYLKTEARQAKHDKNIEGLFYHQAVSKFGSNLDKLTSTPHDEWTKADPYDAVRQSNAEFLYYQRIDEFVKTHGGKNPTIDDLDAMKEKAVQSAWKSYPPPEGAIVGSINKPLEATPQPTTKPVVKQSIGHPDAKPPTAPKSQLKPPPPLPKTGDPLLDKLNTLH